MIVLGLVRLFVTNLISNRQKMTTFLDNLSEWLRRQTRNLLGFARAGSNPAVVVFILLNSIHLLTVC